MEPSEPKQCCQAWKWPHSHPRWAEALQNGCPLSPATLPRGSLGNWWWGEVEPPREGPQESWGVFHVGVSVQGVWSSQAAVVV